MNNLKLANKIVDELFEREGYQGRPIYRIQFMAGNLDDEYGCGGFDKGALSQWLAGQLEKIALDASCQTPPAPEWDGEDWPPVNAECWFCDYAGSPKDRWKRCIFLGVHDGDAIWIYLIDQNEYHTETNVQPDQFRTKEYRERDEAITEAMDLTCGKDDGRDRIQRSIIRQCFEELYDAGMLRKAGDE